ncbi:MAG: DNA-binding protein [Clostridia bacterium]|nr:DNA-binding protein [Clostridia bacterium]
MRGIKAAIEEIKEFDAATALTETYLRRLVLRHEIPSVKAGRKYLINMDILNEYLCKGACSDELTAAGGIRKIAE